MATYSEEFKSALIKKVLSSPDRSVSSIAAEANLNGPTLHRWLKLPINDTMYSSSSSPKRPSDWTCEQKLNVLIEGAQLEKEELGAFCRKKGLYSHQLDTWREEFMTDKHNTLSIKQRAELKALRSKNKELERDLRRKEKALAETAALLVLKKKADLIWGVNEED